MKRNITNSLFVFIGALFVWPLLDFLYTELFIRNESVRALNGLQFIGSFFNFPAVLAVSVFVTVLLSLLKLNKSRTIVIGIVVSSLILFVVYRYILT